MDVRYGWREPISSVEVNRLHADSFDHPPLSSEEWDWAVLVERHALGWVTARAGTDLVGFVDVLWDGAVHAWLQDVMVAHHARHEGIGSTMVSMAGDGAREAGCEWLHVDFDDELEPFYLDACGFRPTRAGLMRLS